MLKQRLLTVAIVLPLFLVLLFFAHNLVWGVALAIVMTAAAVEWARLRGFSRNASFAFSGFVFFCCALQLILTSHWPSAIYNARVLFPFCLMATLFWLLLVPAMLRFRWTTDNVLVSAVVGWLILVPAWTAAVAMQRSPVLTLSVLGAIWIADTAAYFVGRRFGRRRLAPQISPGKTVEGLVGALVAVIGYAMLLLTLWRPGAESTVYVAVLAFAVIFTALSVAGDLFESWWKRQAGVKDSGEILPGHGGILDRIDSATATLPFAMLFLAGVLLR